MLAPGSRHSDFSGHFETHLTVRARAELTTAQVAAAGQRLGLKFIDIVLDRGRTPRQPMFTGVGAGMLSDHLRAAETWGRELAGLGFEVIRVKVEAAPWSAGVPATDREALDEPQGRYFEHHIKLLLHGDEQGDLAAMVAPHQAHLSRNARRITADGAQERFVTQRCHRVGQTTARVRLAALRETLVTAGFQIKESEEEYVVFDSDLSVDAGWIEDDR